MYLPVAYQAAHWPLKVTKDTSAKFAKNYIKMPETCEADVGETFPAAALVPKVETGVLNFLQKYPDYDGRDVTIAIFDSGVDPRASGLETLCDGKTVKVIERFDCTGCGDVDVSKRVTADKENMILGLSGRKLKLTPAMVEANTANGEYHVGLKNFSDLYPSKVRESSMTAMKRKEWDSKHKMVVAETVRKQNEFDAQNGEASKMTWNKKLAKDNIDGVLDMLNNYEKTYVDLKPTYDCILYPTESGWQAVIDNTEKGDLENAVHLGEYTKTHEMKNVDDFLSISINVHDDGDVLEVVGMCSPHGTHVASIASGNHSSRDIDGMAPNAKIVSITIGDGRLGSMETGSGLVRGMIKIMEMCREGRQVDVINMSYGEHAHWAHSGRVGELMSEVVNKYGVVWVVSAGNHGPALCTVGTPPDIAQPSCVGVGAYVSPQMMEAEYAMREKLPGNVYTWTSRDPCIDGGQGVTVCAPGAAITSVPQFTMSKSQLMNGTSMAAPHVAGAVALIISGLKQRNVQYSPFSIKRALAVTANKLSDVDPFAQGNGLLNTEKAFEHLITYASELETMMRFSVRCGRGHNKGIHIRQAELKKVLEYNVTIEPFFFNDKEAAPKDKFNFNVRLNLIPSHPFVQCGAFLDLSYTSRQIVVRVDPLGLSPGVHTAVIRAFDSNCVEKGPLFEIPITVVQPHIMNCEETRTFHPTALGVDGAIEFQPNTIRRHFIMVPVRATWAVLRLRSTDKNREKDIGKFYIHTMQLLPQSSCRVREHMKVLSVSPEYESTFALSLQGDNIIELCIAKYWSNYGTTHLKYCLEFHGIQPTTPGACVMLSGTGVHRMEVSSLTTEEFQPQITLKNAAISLKPTESKIMPLSSTRDVIPEGRQIYQNLLTYALNIPKPCELAIHAPFFENLLYESEFESQLWMLFDSNKGLIFSGDAHSHMHFKKIERGDYIVKLQVRHEKRDLLEKISEANLVALVKLSTTINLDIYDHYNECVIGGRKLVSEVVKDYPPKVLYVAPIAADKLPKVGVPSQASWLCGALLLAKDDVGRRVDSWEFKYVINNTDQPKKNGDKNGGTNNNAGNGSVTSTVASTAKATLPTVTSSSGDCSESSEVAAVSAGGSPRKSKPIPVDYDEAFRDFQCSMITKLELTKAEKIYEAVMVSNPTHLAAILLFIQNIEASIPIQTPKYPLAFAKIAIVWREESAEKPDFRNMRDIHERIALLANLVVENTDKEALLAYIGLKNDTRPDAIKIKSNMDKIKNNLIDALVKRGIALARMFILNENLKDNLEEMDKIYLELNKFIDPTDLKAVTFSIWHAYAHSLHGRAYRLLQKHYEERRTRECYEEIQLIAEALGFDHVKTAVQRLTVTAFPTSYRLF